MNATANDPAATFSPEFPRLADVFANNIKAARASKLRYPYEVFATKGRVDIQPLPVTVKRQPDTREGVLAALTPCVSKDETLPRLTGVHFDAINGTAVATDGFSMISVPIEVAPDEGYLIIRPKDGSRIDAHRIDIDSVMSVEVTPLGTVPIADLLARANAIVKANRAIWSDFPAIGARIDANGQAGLYSSSQILRVLKALASLGTESVTLEAARWTRGHQLHIRDARDRRRFALTMPWLSAPGECSYGWLIDPQSGEEARRAA